MSNNQLAFVFPGQGSQSVGMLAKLAQLSPVVRATFDEASRVLGYDLWQLCQHGPVEDLNSTERTQPAMLAAGIATWRLWQERQGATPAVVTGHSLGEFSALVAAGAIDFTTCVELVRFRGQVMQEAVPAGTGAMAALLGLEDADAEAACAEAAAAGGVVEAVNFNSQGQVVIAGERAAVLRAIDIAKAKGAKRAIELPVSVPAHSSLMHAAGARLGERLAKTEIRQPRIRYVSAVDARTHSDPGDLRLLLVSQLSSPVRWTNTVASLTAGSHVKTIVECGPGQVLLSLVKRIERRRDTQVFALEDPDSFAAASSAAAA
ncbi:MAG TPA: ACP S-malonyltransferase [Steroidobacteraceae bacterium]|jgi:[acyl-carrier-protein] S-malonyltransferase|nr:ACP S-malonyltransferase [Steroidobacteraceae bacterium]